MNVRRSFTDGMKCSALNLRVAKSELSANQIQSISQFGCTAWDALAFIRIAAESAIAQGGAINPESIIAFLTDNNLMLKELSHGQDERHDQPDAA